MNRYIYRVFAAVLTAITIFSCKDARNGEVYRLLTDVDSYIESRPDSALAVLEGIDKAELTTKELEAKYALLMSMALDKNYIDLQSDSVIAPAVRYYERYGSADEKLKMYYYSGRIKQNAGDNEGAMEMFVKGEEYAERCTDKACLGRLYKAKMVLNRDIFNYVQAIVDVKNAAECYLSIGDMHKYYNAINDLAVNYNIEDDEEKFRECMNILKENWDSLTEKQKSHYYAISIGTYNDVENVEDLLREYLSEITDSSLIIWNTVADMYIKLDKPKLAIYALENALIYNGSEKDASYYYNLALISEKLGNTSEALSAYKKYQKFIDDMTLQLAENDTKFIEERYKTEINQIKTNFISNIITVSILILLFIAGIVILLIKKQLLQKEAENMKLEIERMKYEKMYSDALAERDILNDIVEKSSIREKTRQVISDRLEVLNKVIISHITDTSRDNRKAYEELEALISDRASFLESTRKTIENINPDFVTYLESKGLTEDEVNLCCLYAIGMKGKDIKDYTAVASIYKDSSAIRHKLGLMENDTNLSNFLQDLLKRPSGKLL